MGSRRRLVRSGIRLMLPRKIIPLAWRNLTENRRRLLTSVAGTAFAVTSMFMENGFRHAMLDSMVNVIERLDGQIVIVNRTLYTLAIPYRFPLPPARSQARELPGRHRRQPGLRGHPIRLLAEHPEDGSLERICVIGVPLEKDVLNVAEVKKYREQLRPARHGPGRRALAVVQLRRVRRRDRSPSSRPHDPHRRARSSSGSTPSPTAT